MENIVERTNKVRDFLTLFKPSIHPDIVPITDVYGPTGWDPDIQALVVSKETLSGGEASAYSIRFLSMCTSNKLSKNSR